MINNLPRDPRQEAILQILSTKESSVLTSLYFRIKLAAGSEDISLADMLTTLQIPCIMWGSRVIYRNGEKGGVPGVDKQLKRAFLNRKAALLRFSQDETAALLHCGADPNSVYRAAIAKA